ncbi:MAG TPA: protein kinase [Planctomycetota bacterium]|nr:protein kinase [Planctomycetota bacterium]
MSTKDAILGHVCVERGWMSEPQLEECLKECDALSRSKPGGAGDALLPKVLLRRHIIPEMELEALRVEIEKVLKPVAGESGDTREELKLLKLLLGSGRLSRAHLDEALVVQRQAVAAGRQRPLVEILLETGKLTLGALEEGSRELHKAATPVRCTACKAAYSILNYDPGRVYLCKACTGELRPPAQPATAPTPPRPAAEQHSSASSSAILSVAGPVGERIGHYGSLREIGRGGMGVVYKAWDETHQRWVALKLISNLHTIEGLTRFRREVEITRSLHHPNIVAVYEFASIDGHHLLAMQYVDGTTLAGDRRKPRQAVGWVLAVAHALQYAHSRGIVHRDIKPQNILVDRAGKPFLTDFGMARSSDAPSNVTAVGTAMGSPAFMSPEQALGRSTRVDRRSDVYSLGAVLYALVTGRPPFRGATPMETLRRVADTDAPPPSAIVAGIPGALEAVILKCLQKERNDRPQTAKQLADDLERILPLLRE